MIPPSLVGLYEWLLGYTYYPSFLKKIIVEIMGNKFHGLI